ncbi:unnamed protein product, partial [Ceratitis capitata]
GSRGKRIHEWRLSQQLKLLTAGNYVKETKIYFPKGHNFANEKCRVATQWRRTWRFVHIGQSVRFTAADAT